MHGDSGLEWKPEQEVQLESFQDPVEVDKAVARVEAGEVLLITEGGEPIAVMAPPSHYHMLDAGLYEEMVPLELELPTSVADRLTKLSEQTGLSVDQIVVYLILDQIVRSYG